MLDAESSEIGRATPTIKAAVDRVIPADRWPSGWEGGVGEYLLDDRLDTIWAVPALRTLALALDELSLEVAGADFAKLDESAQDEVLSGLTGEAAEQFAILRRLCWEGYYAASVGRNPVGLEMVGFRSIPEGVDPVEPEPILGIRSSEIGAHYDVVVIGSGPGGGVAAQVLTAAGKRVLLVERARQVPNAFLRGDHLHGKRNAVYWPTAGPGPGHPRVAQLEDGDVLVDGTGDAATYGLNAMAFGGGTRLWQGMAWRFLPDDFNMATVYGNPDGASLADWPIDYDDLEPYYSRAEWELGVAGEEGGLTGRMRRTVGYPMPAMGTEPARELLAGAADRLGWNWGPIPLALNSVPHDGRPACVRCAQCVGHACPVNAKNGSNNTFIPRAVGTGLCDVIYDAEAIEVGDGVDRAKVVIMADTSTVPVEVTVGADVVVVSAGAVETPRLLLASGIGNDHLGRHLHDHRFVSVLGEVDSPVKPFIGPGHSIATLDHAHAETIPWGGAMLADVMGLLPLTSAANGAPGVPGWGLAHKEWMREGRRNIFGVFGIGQEIPVPTSRVTLAQGANDRWGKPGAALRKDVHWASREIEAGITTIGAQWLRAANVRGIRRQSGAATVSAAGEHSCGTARMGVSPHDSATDPYGRVHGTKRVVVCDASLHPTNGSVNPVLTIVANSFRVTEHLVENWPTR